MDFNSCPICFESLKGNYISCSNNICHTPICTRCMDSYLDYSIKEKSIPKCTGCSSFFIKSCFKKHISLIDKYNKCCMYELVNRHGTDIKKNMDLKSKIEILRDERKVFLSAKFPKVIAYTATHIMPKKLKKLDTQIKMKMEEESKKSYRICMNLSCKGYLDSEFVCGDCDTKFCKKCENVFETDHVCKNEDIESIKSLNLMTKCPNCHVPIFRYEGCNHMTCAKCGQNFAYNTGEKDVYGSEHVNVLNNTKDSFLLSVEYQSFLSKNDLLQKMVMIESMEPKRNIKYTNNLNKFIARYYEHDEVEDAIIMDSISTAFDKIIRNKNYANYYYKILRDIEKNIINKTLNEKLLDEYIYKFKIY